MGPGGLEKNLGLHVERRGFWCHCRKNSLNTAMAQPRFTSRGAPKALRMGQEPRPEQWAELGLCSLVGHPDFEIPRLLHWTASAENRAVCLVFFCTNPAPTPKFPSETAWPVRGFRGSWNEQTAQESRAHHHQPPHSGPGPNGGEGCLVWPELERPGGSQASGWCGCGHTSQVTARLQASTLALPNNGSDSGMTSPGL